MELYSLTPPRIPTLAVLYILAVTGYCFGLITPKQDGEMHYHCWNESHVLIISILSHSSIDHIAFSELTHSICYGHFLLETYETYICWLMLYSEVDQMKYCHFHINTVVPSFPWNINFF